MNQKEHRYHVPALLAESLDGLDIRPSGVYVDATFGGGGHSRGIMEKLGSEGRLFGFDKDADAENNRIDDKRFTFVQGDFRFLSNFLRYHGVREVNGILADLGVSSYHFDEASRGFSFRFDGKLDMRMNNRAGLTAADVLNTYTEEQLAAVFYKYGELKNSRRIASAVVRQRAVEPVAFVSDLKELVSPFLDRKDVKKSMSQVFQALRIEVNQEIEALRELLTQSLALLSEGGRLVVISYHSLEDRLVKNFIKTGNFEGRVEQDIHGMIPSPFRKVGKIIVPSTEDINFNPRARSAKLRIGEKVFSSQFLVEKDSRDAACRV